MKKNKILLDKDGKITPCPPVGHGQRNTETGRFTDEYGSVRQICLWLEEAENLKMIREHLKKDSHRSPGERWVKGQSGSQPEPGSISEISKWLNKNG